MSDSYRKWHVIHTPPRAINNCYISGVSLVYDICEFVDKSSKYNNIIADQYPLWLSNTYCVVREKVLPIRFIELNMKNEAKTGKVNSKVMRRK
jgi:hypothetical protein